MTEVTLIKTIISSFGLCWLCGMISIKMAIYHKAQGAQLLISNCSFDFYTNQSIYYIYLCLRHTISSFSFSLFGEWPYYDCLKGVQLYFVIQLISYCVTVISFPLALLSSLWSLCKSKYNSHWLYSCYHFWIFSLYGTVPICAMNFYCEMQQPSIP